MKTISVAVLESDYEAFRQAAEAQGRPIAQLIREAMGVYREERLRPKKRLTDVPLIEGLRWIGPPLKSGEAFGEMADERFDRAVRRLNGDFDDEDSNDGWP